MYLYCIVSKKFFPSSKNLYNPYKAVLTVIPISESNPGR